jgi:hypothetical protein
MQMVESRRSERVRSFLRAKILFNNNNTTVDCIVRNISALGAKLEVNNATSVPSQFLLEIPQKGRSYNARIVWRDAAAMGVEFTPLDVSPAHSADTLEGKVERLERENRRLKSTVLELKKRLEDIGQAVDEFF